MQKKNELFEVVLIKNEIRIKLGNNFSCLLWGKYWGILHNIFEKYEYSIVKIDFSKCYWADPIPLLSMLLELIHLKEDCNKYIKIILPRLGMEDKKNSNFSKGQFLKFLSSQGFMRIMIDNFSVLDLKEKLAINKVEKYAKYNYQLLYNGAEVVQAKIYELTGDATKTEIIKEIEEEFLFRFKNTVSLQTYYKVVDQVYNILFELIENVEKHAYSKTEKKRFGLYIRKRYGVVNNYGKDSSTKIPYLDVINKENANSPALDNQILLDNEAILEIFFVDFGMGLKESLKEYYKSQLKKDYKYPVRELFYKVLKEGVRKETRTSYTPFGGLHFIGRILRENKGYIWCNEGKEWVGSSSIGLLQENMSAIKDIIVENREGLENKGLIWCFRIPFSDNSKAKSSIASIWKGQASEHPVFKSYQELDKSMFISRVVCKDDRRNKYILMNGDVNNWRSDIEQNKSLFEQYLHKIDTYIWLPTSYYAKNKIITLLKIYIETVILQLSSDGDKINIVIGEINSNELISYFYALNNISLKNLGTVDISSIVLVTKKWEVVYFENVDGYIQKNSVMSERFFTYNTNNSVKTHENIRAYAKFIRKYESAFFWKFIKEHQKEKIYINANVVWTAQKEIWGYLDFERIYLYKEIYALLKSALLRTIGFVNNAEIEYRSIDLASLRVCQEVGMECLHTGKKEVYPVNVGGACATGYTRESYYKENRVDINIIFFAHPSYNREIKDTAFLFVWPEAGFFEDFYKERDTFYRLGKTNLISKNEKEMIINTKNIYRNVVRNKVQTYRDFQSRYPKFIKYGHYKTENHHYLIGFDLLTYMKYSYIKKEGAFVYFLWKVVNYLRKEGNEEKFYDIKDSEWTSVLNDCQYEDSLEKGEIIIYHSNTFTEYIMQLVKDILPDYLSERIMPINFVEVQSKGVPITFSPFTLEYLKDVLKKCDKRGVMYIDSSFSTGRKMLEVENVLLSAGCSKVTFLSVFDMRRLRTEDNKNYSYWKINMPRLDSNDQCVLCNTLKKLKGFISKVDSELSLRIKEWLMSWNCMSVTNSISGHGIEPVENIRCEIDGIAICDSNILNMYIAETLCESYSNDYVYKFISEKTDLSIYIKMQLICTQLCLYGNQNSRQLQLSLLSELIGNMAKSDEINSYTSLAGLVLLSQSEALIYELFDEILYKNQNHKILSVKKYLLSSRNVDLIITIGYFVKNYYMIEQLLNGYASAHNSEFINLINMHLLPEKDLKLLSKEFAGLLINEQGHRHNTNIGKLLYDHVTDLEAYRARCECVLNDINRLNQLSKHFSIALKNSMRNSTTVYSDIKNDIIQIEKLMAQDEERFGKNCVKEENLQAFIASDELKEAIIKCKKRFDEYIDGYYISFSNETQQYFQNLVKSYEIKYEKKVYLEMINEVNIKDMHKIYYWNQGIEKEFEYLLQNLEHCSKCIEKDIFMRIRIIFGFNSILIKFTSWSEVTADVVKNKFLSKNRLSKEQAISFDVLFDFDNLKKNEEAEFLLESKMSVPACFQNLKGGNE